MSIYILRYEETDMIHHLANNVWKENLIDNTPTTLKRGMEFLINKFVYAIT